MSPLPRTVCLGCQLNRHELCADRDDARMRKNLIRCECDCQLVVKK